MSLCLNESAKRPKMKETNGGSVKSAINRVFKQELDYTTSSQKVLDKHGGGIVTGITVMRDPIEASFVVKSLGLLKKKPFDTLYHLYMLVTLSNGKQLRIEKNEVVSISKYSGSPGNNTESIKISKIPKNKTLNRMLELTQDRIGSNYFRYDAIKNNCQDWLLSILAGNKFGRKEVKEFIKQDVTGLVSASIQKGLSFITRIAGIGKTIAD
jgi:hypothetical protein